MTRSRLGRVVRVLSRPVHVPSSGATELPPPANPAADGSPRRARRRSAARIALRALVCGGFAGAAWLLTAGAAEAAPAEPARPDALGDLPVVTLVDALRAEGDEGTGDGRCPRAETRPGPRGGLLRGAPAVGELLASVDAARIDRAAAGRANTDPATAIAAPCATGAAGIPVADLMADRPEGPAAGGTAADRGRANPVGPARAASQGRADAGAGATGAGTTGPGLLGAVPGLVAPVGQTGLATLRDDLLTPLATVAAPLTAPVDGVLRPATDMLRGLTAPVAGTLDPAPGMVTGDAWAPTAVAHPTDRAVALPTTAGGRGGAAAFRPGGEHRFTSAGLSADAELDGTGMPESRPGSELPDRSHPAPKRGQLGTGAGAPANGGGSPSEGGHIATLSSSVVGAVVASHRRPATAEDAVLQHDAGDPTVSPD